MKLSDREEYYLREILSKLKQGDKRWFAHKEIQIGDKGGNYILNYIQGGRNEHNRLTRGLVVDKEWLDTHPDLVASIVSFPFIRFFNREEEDADKIDFSNSEMIEKMDGSMVGVYFQRCNYRNPEFHTRKMMSVHEPDLNVTLTNFDGKNHVFLPLIKKYVDQLEFIPEDGAFTYVFEFVHEASRVLTKYSSEDNGLYLLGARCMTGFEELPEARLNSIAYRIGAKRPRIWDSVDDENAIRNSMKNTGLENFEGFVFRDRTTGKRVKMKDADYVKLHHLLDKIRFKHLVPIVLKGEEEEILAYFPHALEFIERIKEAHKEYIEKTLLKIKDLRTWSKGTLIATRRKELALKVFGKGGERDKFIQSQIMKWYEEEDDDVIRQGIEKGTRSVALTKCSSWFQRRWKPKEIHEDGGPCRRS
jgi:hypothetical protein